MSLSVDGLRHAWGARVALDGAGFAAPPRGALTAVIGPNASGKTTLFRCVAGLVRPGGGRMTLDGADLAALPARERARRVGYMPQAFVCDAALTVFEVVMLARKQLSGWRVAPEDARAVAALLERMGLDHLAGAQIGEISGGQSQLVSAAQAMARAPGVFLFDEPTSALDLNRQLRLMTLIRAEARARNVAAFVALHDLNLAARFADAMILMRAGRVIAEGPPEAVLADPRVAETYGVGLDLFPDPKGRLHVSAHLRDDPRVSARLACAG